MATTTPLRYPGGKSKTYNYIKELIKINKCNTYCEAYAGGAGVAISLLLNKDVDEIFINDFDKSIFAFWYSVINHSEDLITLIQTTDITIDEWYKQKEVQLNKENNDNLLEIGFSTLFLNRSNRSGILKAGVIGGKAQSGKYKLDCRFNKKDICNRIQKIAEKKENIHLYNMDAEEFIIEIISKKSNCFTFFDPPYYEKGPGLYTNFYEHENHSSLAKTIKSNMINKHWILTYDKSPNIYDMYKEYYNVEYYLNYSIGTPSKGVEFMFYSPITMNGNIENHLMVSN